MRNTLLARTFLLYICQCQLKSLVICLLKIEESAFWMSDFKQKKYFNVLYAMASVI